VWAAGPAKVRVTVGTQGRNGTRSKPRRRRSRDAGAGASGLRLDRALRLRNQLIVAVDTLAKVAGREATARRRSCERDAMRLRLCSLLCFSTISAAVLSKARSRGRIGDQQGETIPRARVTIVDEGHRIARSNSHRDPHKET